MDVGLLAVNAGVLSVTAGFHRFILSFLVNAASLVAQVNAGLLSENVVFLAINAVS